MMTPALRRLTFTAHVTSSVGWVGAVMAFLAWAVIGFTSNDAAEVRGAYLLMAPAAWWCFRRMNSNPSIARGIPRANNDAALLTSVV
jgi:hypothetical protein